MNGLDSCLQRLLRAARRDPVDLPSEVPFGLEARVLAAWRGSLVQEQSSTALVVPLIRRAFLCACAILVVAAALTFHSWKETPPNEMVIVDSAIQLTLMQ
jgi:hypothetical protein